MTRSVEREGVGSGKSGSGRGGAVWRGLGHEPDRQ